MICCKHFLKCLFKICFDIINMLNAHTYTYLIRQYPTCFLFCFVKLLVSGRGRMNYQGLGVAYISQVTGQL